MNNKTDESIVINSIAEVLTEWREKDAKMKACAFAEHAGIEPRQYLRYEEGANMTVLTLFRTISVHNRKFIEFWMAVDEKINEHKGVNSL